MKYRKHSSYPGRILYLILSLVLFLGSSVASFSQGNLLITPRRVVFDGTSRSMDLNLANTGTDTATYAISLVQIRMTAEGGFESITEPDPGQKFADKFLRFFPRSVTLGPGEAQLVKVQVTRRSQLEPGEYRSHFYFRAEKAPTPLGDEDPAVENNSIAVKLTPVFGLSLIHI
jgi:P pilus assembly chaperone PapD